MPVIPYNAKGYDTKHYIYRRLQALKQQQKQKSLNPLSKRSVWHLSIINVLSAESRENVKENIQNGILTLLISGRHIWT